METIEIRDEFIKLGQALKLAGLVDSGVMAKDVILDGLVKVNGKQELQRGKKLYEGDVFSFNGEDVKVTKS
ncbi:MAG: RNA-binding S4 domain-containing protein [Lachnospiraceae bacterium]|mgnify:FL=1|nr:RNA-binding S4 domain-containing protein [Lachnospiraceae bacterium]